MSTVYRATDQPVGARVEYWRHVLGGVLGPIDLRAPVDPDFRDVIRVGRLGAVGVGDLTVTQPGVGDRRDRHTRATDALWQVGVQVSGSTVVEQGDRQAQSRPGDLALVDLSRPSRWSTGPSRAVLVVFPHSLLPLQAGDLSDLTATRIPGDRGVGALASSLARRLPALVDGDSDDDGGGHVATAARLGTTVVDLIATALAARLDRRGRLAPATRRRALLAQAHAFVEANLGDPGLTPATVAAGVHVSVRYLHRLFEDEETTVADLIRRRRLERCRTDLLDPDRLAEPAQAIAARWGFGDPAHFNRLFRRTYGLPPGRYRAEAGPPAA